MRISDWSSDVCSSDLNEVEALRACEVGIGRPGNRDELAAALEDVERFFQRVGAEAVHRDIIAREDLLEVPALVIHHHICPERRSEEHTSELQSLMRISYAVFCLKKKTKQHIHRHS